ncbi:MAG: DUF1062 domain-containing protein [Clostridiales bacterium]|jgi:hypothetical protein|nr:DUF1062 domain-containing protein [Clostridiales bacterium]
MSYLKNNKYISSSNESFRVIRKCSVCGKKAIFINSNKFRVNANGSRIDVWLIYQCKKCKHTYNLTIYERVRKDALSLELYTGFIENDDELARVYGRDKSLFVKNKAEIDLRSGPRY